MSGPHIKNGGVGSDYRAPETLEEAHRRRNQLQADVDMITQQLADHRDRTDTRALTHAERDQWYRSAKMARVYKLNEIRAIKLWIHEHVHEGRIKKEPLTNAKLTFAIDSAKSGMRELFVYTNKLQTTVNALCEFVLAVRATTDARRDEMTVEASDEYEAFLETAQDLVADLVK